MRYEIRDAQGRMCCRSDNPKHLCDKCKRKTASTAPTAHIDSDCPVHGRQAHAADLSQDAPPDPYAADLAKLRGEQR